MSPTQAVLDEVQALFDLFLEEYAMGAAPFRRRASHRTEMAFGPRRESLV
jgi:hypothetical protein